MKSFREFIAEANNSKNRLKFITYYHGTPENSEKEIRKRGFNTSDVYASTSKDIAKSFGARYGSNVKAIPIRVPSKVVKSKPPGMVVKTDGQRAVDNWAREYHTSVMDPDYATKHIYNEPQGVLKTPKIPKEFRKRGLEPKWLQRMKTKLRKRIKTIRRGSEKV